MPSFVEIITPIGPNVVVDTMRWSEALGRVPTYEITVVSKTGNIDFKKLLGGNLTVGIELGDRKRRFINVFIVGYSELGAQRSRHFPDNPGAIAHVYKLTAAPRLWFMTRRANFRYFPDKTARDILATMFGEFGLLTSLKFTGGTSVWEYCCQYRETDFNFVSRIMEQEGLYFYHSHENGKHTLIVADSPSQHAPASGLGVVEYEQGGGGVDLGVDFVSSWEARYVCQPGKYTLADFDQLKPKTPVVATKSKPLQHDFDSFEVYDFPGDTCASSDTTKYAGMRLEELQADCEVFHGSGPLRGLEVGYTFTLTKHPVKRMNTEYLVTAADFYVRNNSPDGEGADFQCNFTALDAKVQYRAPRITPRPVVHGPQPAIVVSDPDKYLRVKVKFPWARQGQDTCWVRVAQEWAGNRYGAFYIPHIGHEVMVDYFEGDPDRPVITGRLYSSQAMPPFALPDNKTQTGLRTLRGNELKFEDKQGAEKIYIWAVKDFESKVEEERLENVGKDYHLKVAENEFHTVTKKYHLKVDGDMNTTVAQAMSFKAGTDWDAKVGAKFATDAGSEIHLKAGSTMVLEAGASLTLKVGGNFININSGGVFIKGSMVMVNSGGAAGSGSGASPDAAEPAKDAKASERGEKITPAKPETPPGYSPQAQSLKLAEQTGAPFCAVCQGLK
ncbi:MAG: type VI secretion system tip protein VgrG [Rhodocyclaceae bacterium]|nr:type VI secretion system tip protein VgrG [Rhodocyclaceae bacterium]MBX3668194.1 type VI secretion system tip protein VgrG [Rhodocyclaceae bacterium]